MMTYSQAIHAKETGDRVYYKRDDGVVTNGIILNVFTTSDEGGANPKQHIIIQNTHQLPHNASLNLEDIYLTEDEVERCPAGPATAICWDAADDPCYVPCDPHLLAVI